jgi:aquaporin Z
MNPAVTLTFWWLGKVKPWDAVFYITAQFVGGALGVVLVSTSLGNIFAHPTVNYVVTQPGSTGVWIALLAEVLISCLLMLVVLNSSNSPRLTRFTGIFAGILVALYIAFEAPYSGMSINPARTVASAVVSGIWTAWWIYFIAPVLGMFLALELYRLGGLSRVQCAKLNHDPRRRCIFCGHPGEVHSSVPLTPLRSKPV